MGGSGDVLEQDKTLKDQTFILDGDLSEKNFEIAVALDNSLMNPEVEQIRASVRERENEEIFALDDTLLEQKNDIAVVLDRQLINPQVEQVMASVRMPYCDLSDENLMTWLALNHNAW